MENETNKSSESDRSGCNYVSGNNVYILGAFDETISKNVVPGLVGLIDEQKSKVGGSINFFINSCGGYTKELYGLLALVELAKVSGVAVTTTVLGVAYSCGSMLAVVGDTRRMYRHAHHLMHLGCTCEESTTYEQLDRTNRRQKEFFDSTIKLYSEHTKMKESAIRKNLSDDCFYLNAEECVKYGLVDEII